MYPTQTAKMGQLVIIICSRFISVQQCITQLVIEPQLFVSLRQCGPLALARQRASAVRGLLADRTSAPDLGVLVQIHNFSLGVRVTWCAAHGGYTSAASWGIRLRPPRGLLA